MYYDCLGSLTHQISVEKHARAKHLPPPPFLRQSSSCSQRLLLVGLQIVHKQCLKSIDFQLLEPCITLEDMLRPLHFK